MVRKIPLINAFVSTLQKVPEVLALLDRGSPDSVLGYIDWVPTFNSVTLAMYQQKPGTVLVNWEESVLTEGEMQGFLHLVNIYVRALRDHSPLELIDAIIEGIPVPGDGLRWRYCPVLTGLLPTTVLRAHRVQDEENVDFYVIETETKEIGDQIWPPQ